MKIQTSIRVEDEFYKEAKVVFKKVGLTFGDAVNLFLSKVAMEKGIPFTITTIQKNKDDDDFMKAQESSMSRTWDNDKDKAWDEL
ncbi:type II toxin-antitoxin system RelB/DinJ family antitoxin [Sulfurimonas sp.]